MQLFHFRNALFSTSGGFVSHHCSVPVRLAFSVIWRTLKQAESCPLLTTIQIVSHFWVERGILNLFSSTDYLFILLKSDNLSPFRSKVPDLVLDLGRGLGRSLRSRQCAHPWLYIPSVGQVSLLSSVSFAREGGQGDLVLMIWSSPSAGECLRLRERSGEAGGLYWCSFSPFERRQKAALAGLWLCPCFSSDGTLPCCFLTFS